MSSCTAGLCASSAHTCRLTMCMHRAQSLSAHQVRLHARLHHDELLTLCAAAGAVCAAPQAARWRTQAVAIDGAQGLPAGVDSRRLQVGSLNRLGCKCY